MPEYHGGFSRDPADEPKDHDLVERIRSGDHLAYRTLFESYAGMLVNFAYGYVRSSDKAHDVVHDVFFSLWESRERLNITGSVGGYLLRATRNRALNMLRSDRIASRWITRTTAAEGDYPVAYNLGPATIADEEFQAAVKEAVGQLPPRLREVFLLHREQGFSYAEIAVAMGIKPAAVTVQMSRALRRLHELLREWSE